MFLEVGEVWRMDILRKVVLSGLDVPLKVMPGAIEQRVPKDCASERFVLVIAEPGAA